MSPDEPERRFLSLTPPLVVGARILRDDIRTRRGRIVVACIFGLLAIVSSTLAALSYNGFCFDQGRFLSETEYFDAVVGRIISQRRQPLVISTPGQSRFLSVDVIPYRDKADFYARNQDCCKTFIHYAGDEFIPPTLGERLFGKAAANVAVTYTLNYVDEHRQSQSVLRTWRAAVPNCGYGSPAR